MRLKDTPEANVIATAIADRCHGNRKPGQAAQRYAIIWQAARLGAIDAIKAQEAELSKARMDLITAGCEWQELAEQKQAVEVENMRLREALKKFVAHMETDTFAMGDNPSDCYELARAALSPVLIEEGE